MPKAVSLRRWLIFLVKAVVVVLVVVFVWRSVAEAAGQLASQSIRPDPGLLALSGVIYLLGIVPMAWFWRQALAAVGQPCGWQHVLPAYYLGHLGKYVPGKALVVVLRTGAIRRAGGETGPIAASVFVETLTLMAVGAVLASLLLVTLGTEGQSPWITLLAIGLSIVAATPTLPPVMQRLLKRLTTDSASSDSGASDSNAVGSETNLAAGISWNLLGIGWLAASATWVALAGSLWFALRSLNADLALTPEVALRCLLAVSLPMVAGFLSLLPGGFLVRDGLMFALLKPLAGVTEPVALAATGLVRLIWVVSEVVACVMLVAWRRVASRAESHDSRT